MKNYLNGDNDLNVSELPPYWGNKYIQPTYLPITPVVTILSLKKVKSIFTSR
jgi:hypothetical protein